MSVKTFEYDHETDGVDIHIRGEHSVSLSSDEISKFFECLMVDRVKEILANNQNVANGMEMFGVGKRCDKCDGKGTVFK